MWSVVTAVAVTVGAATADIVDVDAIDTNVAQRPQQQ